MSAGWGQTFSYDERGNRAVTPQNGLWGLSSQTPQALGVYTSANRVTGWNDASGNVLTLGAVTGVYDVENHLATRTHTVTGALTTYSYDGEGRRVKAQDTSPAQTRVYVYTAQGELAAEYGGRAAASGTVYLGADQLKPKACVTVQGPNGPETECH